MNNKFLNVIPREQIESINFINDNTVPSGVLGSYDVSEKQNGSVMLWYELGNDPELYKVTIGQNGGVKAPIHADLLFSFLMNLEELKGDLITSETRTMFYMFAGAGRLVENFNIDGIGLWDTSRVIDMSAMFAMVAEEATNFSMNLSSWDTSQVTDMFGMFIGAGKNAEIWDIGDIGQWNTSNVTNMSSMFAMAAEGQQTSA